MGSATHQIFIYLFDHVVINWSIICKLLTVLNEVMMKMKLRIYSFFQVILQPMWSSGRRLELRDAVSFFIILENSGFRVYPLHTSFVRNFLNKSDEQRLVLNKSDEQRLVFIHFQFPSRHVSILNYKMMLFVLIWLNMCAGF